MTPTKPRALFGLGVACALVTWLLLVRLYSSLPPLPWTPSLTLVLLAIVEGRSGYLLRRRIAGRWQASQNGDGRSRPKPLHPIGIARTAAVAKASALAAAVIAGLALGFVIDLTRSLSEPIPRQDTFAALGIFASAVLLAVAAVYLERSCRVPGPPGDR
ncbi:MAG TPA: DUF3180 domain-containing protein [Streptosporangiaceae bacterium]|jgi:hypothetical protein|nr:DUF3180 domain-containing protein [Streptosporangiaceae bacterium]